jgi:hypothetical protein
MEPVVLLHCVRNSLSPVPVLSHMNSVHTHTHITSSEIIFNVLFRFTTMFDKNKAANLNGNETYFSLSYFVISIMDGSAL